MKIEYDPEADALYIQVREAHPHDNIDIEEGVTVDVDEHQPPEAGGSLRGPTPLSRSERFGALRVAARYGSSDSLGRASPARDLSKSWGAI